jgi:hypothetical protein
MYGMAWCEECQRDHPPAPQIAGFIPLEAVHVQLVVAKEESPCPHNTFLVIVLAPPEMGDRPMGVSTTVYYN